MDVNKSPAAAKALEAQLAAARQQMMGLVTEAAKLELQWSMIQNGIYNASQTVIIFQRISYHKEVLSNSYRMSSFF